MARRLLLAILIVTMLFSGVASADRDSAHEKTITLEEDSFDIDDLLELKGEPVEVWIEEIESINGSTPHAIDVYIATWDEYWDHFCDGEGNMFAEEFAPVYTKENLAVSELPFHFSWTPEDDEDYLLIFDNCDNQRTTDYKDNVEALRMTYAVDDQTDEIGEAVATGLAALLGGSLLLCCGIPLCFAILLVILIVVVKRKKDVPAIVVAPDFGTPAPSVQAPIPVMGAQPTMGQPGMGAPPAAAPALAPVAAPPAVAAPDPAAKGYYDGLIAQGYAPDQAASYTAQHYPGFQP